MTPPSFETLPTHIAFIMDGNGRWAEAHGKSRTYGHERGVETLKNIAQKVLDLKIPYMTVWAFSTENWKRPTLEINHLINLLYGAITSKNDPLKQKPIRLRFMGRQDNMPKYVLQAMKKVEDETNHQTAMTLTVAFDYGGQDDILQATRQLMQKCREKKMAPEDLTPALFEQHLRSFYMPSPDLIVRTGHVHRLSNFFLWQAAYSELFFSQSFWPDFSQKDLYEALQFYEKTQRRFGGL